MNLSKPDLKREIANPASAPPVRFDGFCGDDKLGNVAVCAHTSAGRFGGTMKPNRFGARWALLPLVFALVAGCSHVQLISPYDETTDRMVTALHKSTAEVLDELETAPTPGFAAMSKRYSGLKSELRAVQLRNEARPKNKLTIAQLQEFKANVDKLEKAHREGLMAPVMVQPMRDAFDQTFRAILTLELAKKELNEGGE